MRAWWRKDNPSSTMHPLLCCSVAKSGLTLCDPMDCSTLGFPVFHYLPELAQTHVHWVSDAIQPTHPLSPPSPPAFNLPQHQGLLKWVSSLHQVAKGLELLQHQCFQWIFRINLLKDGLVGSPCSPRDSQESSPAPQFKCISSSVLSLLLWYNPCYVLIQKGGGNGEERKERSSVAHWCFPPEHPCSDTTSKQAAKTVGPWPLSAPGRGPAPQPLDFLVSVLFLSRALPDSGVVRKAGCGASKGLRESCPPHSCEPFSFHPWQPLRPSALTEACFYWTCIKRRPGNMGQQNPNMNLLQEAVWGAPTLCETLLANTAEGALSHFGYRHATSPQPQIKLEPLPRFARLCAPSPLQLSCLITIRLC